MIAFAKPDEQPEPRGSGGDSALAEYTRQDLVLIRSMVAHGVVPAERMAEHTAAMSELMEQEHTPDRLKVAIYKTLAALQLGMLKIWTDLHKQPAASAPVGGTTHNQQINIYLPSNAREVEGVQLTNGNGRH